MKFSPVSFAAALAMPALVSLGLGATPARAAEDAPKLTAEEFARGQQIYF